MNSYHKNPRHIKALPKKDLDIRYLLMDELFEEEPENFDEPGMMHTDLAYHHAISGARPFFEAW